MSPSVPADDTERVRLSGPRTLLVSLAYPALWVGALAVGAVVLLVAGGREVPVGAVVLALLLLAGVVGWRWGTPLRGVVATRTGLLVTGLRDTRFVPYASVASAREDRLQRHRPITVTLREPVAGLDRFVFVPPLRSSLGIDDAHPSAVELLRRLERLRCDECGSPFIQGSSAMPKLCAECAHLLYGSPACPHQFGPGGSCGRCGWDRSRSEYTAKLAAAPAQQA